MKAIPTFSMQLFVIIILFSNILHAQSTLKIKFQPDDYVYVYETKGFGTPNDLYSAVIQNIAIVNHDNDSLKIKEVEIIVSQGAIEIQRYKVPEKILFESAQKFNTYQKQGVLEYYDFQFQTSKYLNGINFSKSTTLAREEALVITHQTMLFQTLPDLITVIVRASDNIGNSLLTEGTLRVINHKSNNQYYFPLKGTWTAYGAPSLISHHRWGSIQEFAFDLVKIGANGNTHNGDGSKLTDYYSFGESVYAIGSGKVVSIFNGGTESNENLKQPNESSEEYFNKSAKLQQELLSKGFSYVMGNHIIIEHDNDEYSHYAHLKTGSLKVKVGDSVNRGQQIAALGHSGNSTEPHLHFHVTDGPDMAYSRSIPVSFDNISFFPDDDKNVRHIHYGQILITHD
ncbi:Peptidase family M23 [Flavobacteriaceae bacterium MAR_2010_188]|nr:Peptidase family M23 [Flavobacteriaceae bacterium MAR_2010_188]